MASKLGVWINNASENAGTWKCSSCDYEVKKAEGNPLENGIDHCPVCGAKKTGETKA